jgi:serine/threonine-protein kinase
VAEDAELHRQVALKRIQDRHGDHPESRARFLLEAEVTGGLEHPWIVPVYGLGHYDDGRPFYAMRFIKGDSLREAIRRFHRGDAGRGPGERALELQKLLRRFLDVCNAIAYAHSRGVLHRDIKPGNIMVGQFGETLVVDWGLAKVIGASEPGGEATLRPPSASGPSETLPGSAIGTPAFMSPEQAAGRLDQLGPASDVYSLGATLYAVLTGRAPIEGSELEEVLDRVRRGDWPPPRQVRPGVPRAMEAICLKAMALRPEERYLAPRALADDIERWLAEEPVSAWREPLWSRARRWARRHQAAVAGTAAMLVTALLALAGGIVAVSLRERETRRQSLRAEANFQKAVDAVERFLTRVGDERLRDVPQMETIRAELLEDALEFQRGFLVDRGDAPGTRLGVARAARIAGDLQCQLSRQAEAEDSCRQALAAIEDLLARWPHDRRYRREHAAALDSLGLVLDMLGRSGEAEASYRWSIDLREALLAEEPGSAEDRWRLAVGLHHLGVLLHGAGRLEEAESALDRGHRACEDAPASPPPHPRLSQELTAILGLLARVLKDRGRPAEALDLYDRAIRMQRARLAASLSSPPDREVLFVLLQNLANAQAEAGRSREAEHTQLEARDLALRLKDDYPAILRYRQGAAAILTNLANGLRRDPARAAEARSLLDQAIAIQEGLVAIAPTVPDYLSKLAQMCDALANFLRFRGDLDDAESVYRKELAYQARLAREHPRVTDYCFGHGQVLHNLADLLRERGRLEDALPLSREAVQILGGLYRSNPRNPDFRRAYSYASWTLAQTHVERRDHRAASEAVAEYLRIEPNGFEESFESAGFLCRCATLCREDPSVAERETLARAYADRAMEALRTAIRNGFRDPRPLQAAEPYGALRDRQDFRTLLAELLDGVFPADPFGG